MSANLAKIGSDCGAPPPEAAIPGLCSVVQRTEVGRVPNRGSTVAQLGVLFVHFINHNNTEERKGRRHMTIINRSDIYDKNLNFLIGSGASVGLFPTLQLGVKNSTTSESHTLETLAKHFENDDDVLCLLFSYYVENVIAPASRFSVNASLNKDQKKTLSNYVRFLATILSLIIKKGGIKKANIFTTNYDGIIAHVAERMIASGRYDFILNDGATGFIKRTLQTRSFNRFWRDQGSFDQHEISVPQINLIQPHGSVYWYKDEDEIEVSYDTDRAEIRANNVPTHMDPAFEAIMQDPSFDESEISSRSFSVPPADITEFWKTYRELPVVNPTKWKFHETVFEEHYYQALRILSYELEKPNTVFIIFGFSFSDEHILSLVKRSLSNPTLKIYLCCYSDKTRDEMESKFSAFDNVTLVRTTGALDFEAFNDEVFTASAPSGAGS
ncbi:hypothetical protein [Sagittula sp.]|uniref:hypothetical protein n=1 Tax=Sagittula sp. TaxID=2038081 RepID=UPI0035194593